MLNPPVNGKIQGLFMAFECFSSTVQDKFNFQGLFKTVLYIQVLFKPAGTPSFDDMRVYAACNTQFEKNCRSTLECGYPYSKISYVSYLSDLRSEIVFNS